MRLVTKALCCCVALSCVSLAAAPAAEITAETIKQRDVPGGYTVVVSKGTLDDPQWGPVAKALAHKYRAKIVVYQADVSEAAGPLREAFDRYACFVARPEEAGREYVIRVHRLTRKLDEDPYTDVLWGILTGCRPDDAMRIVAADGPLIVRKAAAGTGIDLTLFDEGVWYSEGEKNAYFEKKRGGEVEKKKGPDDTTKALVDVLNVYRPDLFVTSGHATDRDWQIGYSYANGQFRCKDGVLFGVDLKRHGYPIRSPNPKVYLPAGNCLMGRIRDKQSMALAWLGSGGVNQMIGYVVSTWYGRGGWGTRDYFFAEPGRYTLSEAFYFNNQAIVHQLETRFPKTARAELNSWDIERDRRLLGRLAASLGYRGADPKVKDNLGLLWDRDTVAFYGDPAWEARLAPRKLPTSQKLTVRNGRYTLQITAEEDYQSARPPAVLLPHRVQNVRLVHGEQLAPLITDNFIMLTDPGKFEKGKTYRVVFLAKEI